MAVRDGLPTSVLVQFPSGHPDGNVSWRLLDAVGLELTTGSITIPVGAVSTFINIPGSFNNLSTELVSSRDVEWTYTVGGETINGEFRYSVEARPPYGVTPDGVRNKLGLTVADLKDHEISLILAYARFRDTVGADLLTAITDETSLLLIREAIEAQAGLDLLPTLIVRVAQQEESGTNVYKRQTVDWAILADALAAIVGAGILEVLPTYDPTPSAGALFIVATPATDPYTGGSYTT